jgi:LmbE family N-acetylglucosaminyl deacetylase
MVQVSTILAFHAHPDDEVLLTGGTLARLASEGHRVIVAVATDGVMGAATAGAGASARLDELQASAAALGIARVAHLGYADSGHGPLLYPDPPDRVRFARAAIDEAAERVADLLREERVDVLLSYDPHGGYGHRDHVKVHEVGGRAAAIASTPRVLQATLPRESMVWLLSVARFLRLALRHEPEVVRPAYSPRSATTHRVDVRPFVPQKRAALAAHRSQVYRRGRGGGLLGALLRLPTPIFGLVMGWEWFVEEDAATPVSTTLGDILQPASAAGG